MKRSVIAGVGLLSVVVGCGAGRPPTQLLDARAAYQKVSSDPAAPLVVDDLIVARKALDAAEKSFKHDGASAKTKTLAYVAERRAIAVDARAAALKAEEDKRSALAQYQRFEQQQALSAREELERADKERGMAQAQAEAERQARTAADAKAAAVEEDLGQVSDLKAKKDADRGLVMTFPGGVLFATGKSELLPAAKDRLSEIANALREDHRTLLVLGHTDASGSDAVNQRTSAERADAVRLYLVEEGIEESRIRSEGRGKSDPIADNKTAEGRANNRRVEIILEKLPGSGAPTMKQKEPEAPSKKPEASPKGNRSPGKHPESPKYP